MYGICNLGIVPMRTEPSDKSELCTQLLFGDGYHILEKSDNDKWLKIKLIHDEYEGWIDILQHNQVSASQFESFLLQLHGICFDDLALADSHHETKHVHLGCSLPFLNGRNFIIGKDKYSFEGELYQINKNITTEYIHFLCLRFLNAPYLWGGKTLFGIDCSGFVQQVYKLLGYQLKRDAYQQAEQGQEVLLEENKIGDLAFFENNNGKIVHVGIILEKNNIIHAHGKVRIDILDKNGILNLTTKKYSHKLTKIKRILDISNT